MQYNVEIVLKLFDQFSRALSQPLEQVKKLENELKHVQENTANLQSPFQRLQKIIKETFDTKHIKEFSDKLDSFASDIAKATAIPLAGIGGSLWAFADIDQARANLEVAFMLNKNAATTEELKENEKYLKEIIEQTNKLGDLYPGSTKDYLEMATALKTVGLSAETIANGALKAAANLWVLVKDTEHVSTEQAAEYIAKFKEAYNIADKDFQQFVDRLQKVKFATGLRLDEIAYASEYLAPTLNILNLKGLQAFNTVSTLLGALRKLGIEGSVAGTSVKDALEHIANLDDNVKRLQKKGIDFNISSKDFFENGQFQLEKFFAVLREKLSQVEDVGQRMRILHELFGAEGLRGVALLVNGTKEQALEYIDTLKRMGSITDEEYQRMKEQINKGGFTGLEKVADEIHKQADLNERTAKLINTFKNTVESLEGTFANFAATVGSLFAPTMTKILSSIINYLSIMQDFIENHRKLATAIALLVGGGLGFLALLGIVAKIGSMFLSLVSVGFQVIAMFSKLAFVIARMLIPALNLLRIAFLTNPIGLLITAVIAAVAAGYLLWKNWDKVAAWFKSHFPTTFKVVSTVINKIIEVIKSIANLNLFEAGKKILTTLVDGIKSVAYKPIEIMKNVVQKIRNLLPFSPAKEGPLRDLHRIKLIETIADAIKPSPLIEKMQNVLSKALLPVPAMTSSVRTSASTSISVYIGNITISANTNAEISKNVALEIEKEVKRVLERINSDRERRKY